MNKTIAAPAVQTEEVYRAFKGRVYGYIKNRINNPEDAEDLMSCVFLKIHEKMDSYDRGRASLSTWIYAIARNTVNDYFRRMYKSEKSEPYDDALGDCAGDDLPVLDKLILDERLEWLAGALERLPERERDIIVLRFYYDRPSREVAGMMNLSHENVRYLQHVAIGKLKKMMDAEGKNF